MSKEMTLNTVTFALALVPENAGKIDAINKIILGEAYTTEAPKSADTAETQGSSTASKKSSASAKKSVDDAPTGPTFDEFKKACSTAKKEHGEDFVISVLEEAGVEKKATLLKTVSAADEDMYQAIMDALEEGPQEAEEDDLDDDGFDDDADGEEIDPEAVKTALRAKAKEDRDEAKAIMNKHGAPTLSKVADLSQDKLAAIMKELA